MATCESKQGIKAGKMLNLGVAFREGELIKLRVENTPRSSDQQTLPQQETYFYRSENKTPYVSLTVSSGTLIHKFIYVCLFDYTTIKKY